MCNFGLTNNNKHHEKIRNYHRIGSNSNNHNDYNINPRTVQIMNKRDKFFEEAVSSTLERIKNLLIVKGKEYRRNSNPFHNFERGSEISGNSPSEVLQGFLLKHLISVEDIRNDLKAGKLPKAEKVNEKYDDIIVYFLIEKAMMLENCKK